MIARTDPFDMLAGSIDSSTGDKIQPDVWALWVNVGDGYYYYETDGTNDETVVYYTSSPTFSYMGTDCTPVRAPAAPLTAGTPQDRAARPACSVCG